MIILFAAVWGTAMLFSIAAALIYILTNSAQGFYLPNILTNITLLFPVVVAVVTILTDMRWKKDHNLLNSAQNTQKL